MPIEVRGGRKTLVIDIAIPTGEPGDKAIRGYEALLGVPACAVDGGPIDGGAAGVGVVELNLDSSQVLRLSRMEKVCREGSSALPLNGPLAATVDANLGAAGGRIAASFSLEQGWTSSAQSSAGVLRRLVIDHAGYAWLLNLKDAPLAVLSTLHVPDVEEAAAWYPRFLKIMGFGDATRIKRYGACIDIETEIWSLRLIVAMAWPLSASGIVPPSWWRGSTGELCVAPDEFEAARTKLLALGLQPRVTSTGSFLAVTDVFGHEWYLSS